MYSARTTKLSASAMPWPWKTLASIFDLTVAQAHDRCVGVEEIEPRGVAAACGLSGSDDHYGAGCGVSVAAVDDVDGRLHRDRDRVFEVHDLAFGPFAVSADQHEFADEAALDGRVGARHPDPPAADDADPVIVRCGGGMIVHCEGFRFIE